MSYLSHRLAVAELPRAPRREDVAVRDEDATPLEDDATLREDDAVADDLDVPLRYRCRLSCILPRPL